MSKFTNVHVCFIKNESAFKLAFCRVVCGLGSQLELVSSSDALVYDFDVYQVGFYLSIV